MIGGFLFTRFLSSICSAKIKRLEGFVGATCPDYRGFILKDGLITCAGTNSKLTRCTPYACAATGPGDVGRVFS
uniref:Putative secreted protein n=1 Tax=Ixodes scapularis TaxID=6945 RepID=A0A4D5RYZ2_IXOSC